MSEQRLMNKIPVLFQDNNILVVNKPAGLSVHNNEDPQNLLQVLEKQLNIQKVLPVHRLDKETSGVQILALNPKNAALWAKQFEDNGVDAIIFTDIHRDGMMNGLNLDATVAFARELTIPVIASGGVTNLDDIRALCAVESEGIIGTVTGRAIYEGSLDLRAAQALADQLSAR